LEVRVKQRTQKSPRYRRLGYEGKKAGKRYNLGGKCSDKLPKFLSLKIYICPDSGKNFEDININVVVNIWHKGISTVGQTG